MTDTLYVLVPETASEAMTEKGCSAADDKRWAWCGYGERKPGDGLDGMHAYVGAAYAAMLAASGSPAMTENEAVERMARAICLSGGYDPDERMANDGPRWRYYGAGALAAFRALRSEP